MVSKCPEGLNRFLPELSPDECAFFSFVLTVITFAKSLPEANHIPPQSEHVLTLIDSSIIFFNGLEQRGQFIWVIITIKRLIYYQG